MIIIWLCCNIWKKEDGSLDANFLTKGTPSFAQYYVLDENGEIVESLEEYDLNYNKINQLDLRCLKNQII